MTPRPAHPDAAAASLPPPCARGGRRAGGPRSACGSPAPPGGAERWARTNHRGEPVTLLEGPAYAAGALAGALPGRRVPARARAAATLATAGGRRSGAYDDLAGDGSSRGPAAATCGALRRGEVSTGAVKLAGLGLTGLVARRPLPPGRAAPRRTGGPVDGRPRGALVAGTANLVNLLDLRPGRALKAVAALGRWPRSRAAPAARGGRRGRAGAGAAAGRPGGARPCSATPAPTRPERCSARPCVARLPDRRAVGGAGGGRRADPGQRAGQLHRGDRAGRRRLRALDRLGRRPAARP